MTEITVKTVELESVEDALNAMEDEIVNRTNVGFGLTGSEKAVVYGEIRRGFRKYAGFFLRNVTAQTAQEHKGPMQGDGEGHRSHYIVGESKTYSGVSLFLCYKDGGDSVGPVKNLELGAFDDRYDEEMKERLCARLLFDESFNHILATPVEPTLKIHRPDLSSAGIVEDIYRQLIRKTKKPLIQRIAAYFR
jgi:hypothetical protein